MSRVLSIAAFIVCAIAVTGCGASRSLSAGPGGSGIATVTPPAYIPGPLDGERTPRADALRRPVAVMVENYYPDSRPQSGLSGASLIYETLAEGGVTRFMAIYLEHGASKVGPVRSTRVYFNDWAAAYHAILVHVGGNDDAQAGLWHLRDVFNVDENKWEINLYNTGTPLFWRGTDRAAPHNMYTSTGKVWAYAARNKQDWHYANASLDHKSPAPLKDRGHVTSIHVTFENPLDLVDNPAYDVQYTFDRKTDTYTRFMGGAPHIDPLTGQTLSPANVIDMKVGAAAPDPYAGITPQSIVMPVTGQGPATYFLDGKAIAGHWQQANQNAPVKFYDARWHAMKFNPGQTWVEVTPAGSGVTWQ